MSGAALVGRLPLSVLADTLPDLDRELLTSGTLRPRSSQAALAVPSSLDPAAHGLVISAKTARKSGRGVFPSRDLVGMAAATLTATAGERVWAGSEGPQWFVTVSPGSIRVGSVNLSKGQRSANGQVQARGVHVELLAAMADDAGNLPTEAAGESRLISAWSAKSRANMTRRLATLDYNDLTAAGVPVLVTLTYPAEWLSVAPDGRAVKRHLKAFRNRWTREFGSSPVAVWKLEFQRRGAPHFHLLAARPAAVDYHDFRLWIATAWSEIVGHPDELERAKHLRAGTRVDQEEAGKMSDPRRVGVYFAKHGLFSAKDYQNNPPEEWAGGSIGRMWGYWALAPADVGAPVSADQALDVARTLRRLHHRARYLRAKTVQRVEQTTGRVRFRTVRRPIHRMPGSRGFVTVNDGPSTALLLDRVVEVGLGAALSLSADPVMRRARLGAVILKPSRLPR